MPMMSLFFIYLVIILPHSWKTHKNFYIFSWLLRDLFSCSESGSDTYVRMYLLPDQTWKHRKRTPVKKKTVNPVFNEMYEPFFTSWKPTIFIVWNVLKIPKITLHLRFEFAVSPEEARNRKLDVAVKNNKMLHKRERKEIGMVSE